MKPRFLLHTCCAPCSAYIQEILKPEFEIVAYFYNPNIHPETEYQKRLQELKRHCQKINLTLIKDKYDKENWFKLTEDYKDEPERGKRCEICYRMRLKETAKYAKINNFDIFGTTLTISPHKSAALINQIGEEIAETFAIKFYVADFKKKEGFKKACDLSKQEGFYRQEYCGCIYSMRQLTHKTLQ